MAQTKSVHALQTMVPFEKSVNVCCRPVSLCFLPWMVCCTCVVGLAALPNSRLCKHWPMLSAGQHTSSWNMASKHMISSVYLITHHVHLVQHAIVVDELLQTARHGHLHQHSHITTSSQSHQHIQSITSAHPVNHISTSSHTTNGEDTRLSNKRTNKRTIK